ncbi:MULTISPECIES: hypothetical protein [unclassified Streptomyces]|uniref:hypothetical protein n=1 Tax=unclassified Streptomyces TaxID=2593676 RepID=UPI000B1036EA|nr:MULTISPECIES: hypothetical protein [unclassified Streptomyces]
MRRIHRTGRDRAVDLGVVPFAACFAAVSSQSIPVPEDLGQGWRTLDQVAGGWDAPRSSCDGAGRCPWPWH